MDYFVNIENAPCQQWQVELLIESFKKHKLQDNLVVGLAVTDVPPDPAFCRNLSTHRRTANFRNMGEVRGYDRMNRLFGMVSLLRLGLLKQPFVLLEPDCVLYKPVEIKSDDPHVAFQVNPFFTQEAAKERIPNLDKYLTKDGVWACVGGVFYFNNLPLEFFDRVLMLTELLAYEQARVYDEIWKHTERAAWAANLHGLIGRVVLTGSYTLEMTMNDYRYEHNFISYNRGLCPYFLKSMFTYTPPLMLSFGDPFVTLAKMPESVSTAPTQYIAELARACLDSRTATH